MTEKSSGIQKFIKLESLAGLLLCLTTVAALLLANSSWSDLYAAFTNIPFEIRLGEWSLNKPLILWINDGLMAIFFLLVAMELKREIIAGELSKPSQIVLPLVGSIGGIVVPALLFLIVTGFAASTFQGWAIPIATDIAFALAILSAFGSRIPASLKTFLLTLAVFDDLGAILIIAFVFTGSISWGAQLAALTMLIVLVGLNRAGVTKIFPYFLVGTVMWVCVLKSGVHATLAGVLLGLCIPYSAKDSSHSPLKQFEHRLHPWVSFLILPLFAFSNAGVDLRAINASAFVEPLTLGIILGLVVGKTFGVFVFSTVLIKLGLAKLPKDSDYLALFGVSIISGVGFTMSLFIGTLAFESNWLQYGTQVKLGVLTGSTIAIISGVLALMISIKKSPQAKKEATEAVVSS